MTYTAEMFIDDCEHNLKRYKQGDIHEGDFARFMSYNLAELGQGDTVLSVALNQVKMLKEEVAARKEAWKEMRDERDKWEDRYYRLYFKEEK